ncbi:MAG: hypothetical protein V2A75_01760 [Pseudomonadota bacterium]
MNRIDTFITKIDTIGDQFLETIIKPIAKGALNLAINDTKLTQSYLTLKTAFMENKISIFLQYLSEKNNIDAINFIDDLNDAEKKFFIESVNKVIDLDNSLQIYILALLTKNFITNGKLNYYEKSLYYGINQISEDDFTIYYCFYSKKILGNEKTGSFYIDYELENKEVIEIVLNKFISLGIIKDASTDKGFRIELFEFSKVLYQYLADYFDAQVVCDDWMRVNPNKTGMWKIKMVGI